MQRSVTMNLTDMDTEEAFRNDHETLSGEDPFAMFGEWLELAHRKEINDANAMALATAGPDGLPNVRMVLLKGFDSEGFVFTPIPNPRRASNWRRTCRRQRSCIGNRCVAKFAFGVRSAAFRPKRRMPILSLVPEPVGSAPGPADSHAPRSPHGLGKVRRG